MRGDPLVGSELGDYRLMRVLGRGGMGVVYEAEDLALRRTVALKVLAPYLVDDRLARTRFQREIQHAVAIEHPHIVPVYSAGFERPHFYIAMRLIPGRDLAALVQDGPLAEGRALRLLGQIASALAAVHERRLVHRDVKPQNVLVWSPGEDEDEHAMLTDFGIAKALDESRGITGMGVLGTPAFMAPEVCLGRPATPASDQYSFACMAFAVLSGQSPYDADGVHYPDAHIEQAPRSLADVAPQLAPAVVDAVERALAKDPAKRHASMRDFVRSARPAAEAFERSQAIGRVLTESTRPEEAVLRLLTEQSDLTDVTIASFTEVDRAAVARARRRRARSAPVGEPQRLARQHPFAGVSAARGNRNSSLTRVRPVFEAALRQDPSGASWLATLIARAPSADALSPEIRREPGRLLSESTATRTFADPVLKRPIALAQCFEHRIAPAERFLRWCIDHPERLTWPTRQRFSAEAQRWRRALFLDDPPGREIARAEAHAELDRLGAAGGYSKWWVFEGRTAIDCLLVTDRLALAIEGKRTERLAPSTSWYPFRSQLVRTLEAVHEIADGRESGLLLITEAPDPVATQHALAASVGDAAPHLSPPESTALVNSYLGQITWRDACDALEIPFASLPDTTSDLT